MTCASCGSENLPHARFCAACGARVDGAGAALVPRAPAVPQVAGPAAVPMLFLCPHCGRPMRPMAYFTRGVNIAKALFLMMPLSVFGPLLLFILRKDRYICSVCKRLLADEAAIPLLASGAVGAAGALATYDPEQDAVVLAGRSRTDRGRAWRMGSVGAGMVGMGLVLGAQGSLGATTGLFLMSAPMAIGAVFYGIRSRTLGRRAGEKRGRDRRARVLELARLHGGRLNVSLVAAELRLELQEADELLGSMVDGQRVEMDVDDAGRITYVFTELAGR